MSELEEARGIRRVRLTAAYDGTDFSGFQRQSRLPSVQGVLENALSAVTGEQITVVGAGRTDAGVHARGQVIHFETRWPGPVEKLPLIAGSRLPPSVVLRAASVVDGSFHARYSARFRRYGYAFFRSAWADPLRRRFALQLPLNSDIKAMQSAALSLVGYQDFSSFVSGLRPDERLNCYRNVQMVRWLKRGPSLLLLIQADGFLRHMVRNIVGTLIAVGSGRMDESEFVEVLASGDRSHACTMAPAAGLCLLKVGY